MRAPSVQVRDPSYHLSPFVLTFVQAGECTVDVKRCQGEAANHMNPVLMHIHCDRASGMQFAVGFWQEYVSVSPM